MLGNGFINISLYAMKHVDNDSLMRVSFYFIVL